MVKQKKKRGYFDSLFCSLKDSLKCCWSTKLMILVADVICVAIIYSLVGLWKSRILTLVMPFAKTDPQMLIETQDIAGIQQISGAYTSLLHGLLIYTPIVLFIGLFVLTLSRFFVWGRVNKTKFGWKSYLRFLWLDLIMFLCALPFIGYCLFAIANGVSMSTSALKAWAVGMIFVYLLRHHFRLFSLQHFFAGKKVVDSVVGGIKDGFKRFHLMIIPYLIMLVPMFLLVNLWVALLQGMIVTVLNAFTVIAILSVGRFFLAKMMR